MTVATVNTPVQPIRTQPALPWVEKAAIRYILALLYFRWLAGIAENFGFGSVSEIAGLIMLIGIGLLALKDLRVAKGSALFLIGTLAWIFVGILSFLANPDLEVMDAVSLFALLALYGLFLNAANLYLKSALALHYAGRLLVAFTLVGSGLALFQYGSGTGFVEAGKDSVMRAFGSDVHPVSFSIQMLAALVGLEIVRVKCGRPRSALYCVLIGLGVISIYLTFARTAWVMALLVVTYSIISRSGWGVRFACILVAVAAACIAFYGSDRFSDLNSLPVFLSNFRFSNVVFDFRFVDNSVSWRIVNWSFGLTQALEQPILGFGPGQSAESSYFNLEMHNILLESFFEGGVLGLFALVLVLFGLGRLHRNVPATTSADRYVRSLINGFGLSLFFAVMVSTSLVDQLMTILLYLLVLTLSMGESMPTITRPRRV